MPSARGAFQTRGPATMDGDRADLEIEDFGLAENLMIEVAIMSSGCRVVRRAVAPGAELTDLAAFAQCLADIAGVPQHGNSCHLAACRAPALPLRPDRRMVARVWKRPANPGETMAQDLRDQDLLDYESRNQPVAPVQRYILRLPSELPHCHAADRRLTVRGACGATRTSRA